MLSGLSVTFSQCVFDGVEPSVPEFQIRFYIIALSPFVPCFQEKNLMLRLLVFYQFYRVLNCFLKLFRCTVYQWVGLDSCTWRTVPLREKRRIDIFP